MQAGLDHMQISIDNVMPDAVSKKSLKVLDAKLKMLAEGAEFHVNINSVVGGGAWLTRRMRTPFRQRALWDWGSHRRSGLSMMAAGS